MRAWGWLWEEGEGTGVKVDADESRLRFKAYVLKLIFPAGLAQVQLTILPHRVAPWPHQTFEDGEQVPFHQGLDSSLLQTTQATYVKIWDDNCPCVKNLA